MNRILVTAMTLAVMPVWADDKPAAVGSLIGRWEVTAATFNGRESAGVKGWALTFGDEEVTTDDGGPVRRVVSYSIKSTATLKEIAFDRRGDGGTALGIYLMSGNELKICYAEPGAARPTQVESKSGDRQFLLVLKRVKD